MSTRYINIKEFKIDATTYTTLQSVSINQKRKKITDSGDNDQHQSFGAAGPGETDVDVELRDPVQAHAIKGDPGTITFKGVPETGGTEVLVTVEGFTPLGHTLKAQHGNLQTQTVPGTAWKADGTDPVTIAAV